MYYLQYIINFCILLLYFWLMAKINEWMNEWNRPSYNFLPYSTILSSCWFGSNHVLCLQVPRQWCWGFRPPFLRIFVISINVFFFFSSDQPTEKKETHSTLNEEKGDGLTEVKKKTTVFVSAESRALQSRHFVESGCLWIHVLNFPKCWC